jgi:hypothetical protein
MSAITSEETVLRIAAADADPLNLSVDSGAPVAVRIEVQGTCTCQGSGSVRPGSYTDTDFGHR